MSLALRGMTRYSTTFERRKVAMAGASRGGVKASLGIQVQDSPSFATMNPSRNSAAIGKSPHAALPSDLE